MPNLCVISPSSARLSGKLFPVPGLIVRLRMNKNTLNSFTILSPSVKIIQWSFTHSSTREGEADMHRARTGILRGEELL